MDPLLNFAQYGCLLTHGLYSIRELLILKKGSMHEMMTQGAKEEMRSISTRYFRDHSSVMTVELPILRLTSFGSIKSVINVDT